MPAVPSIVTGPTVRQVAGYRRHVNFTHPGTGSLNLLVTQASWDEALTPQYNVFALTPPTGPKQKIIHSRGTKEISWNITGDLTRETITLANLLKPENRGVDPTSLRIQQGAETALFSNPETFNIPWGTFSLTGAQNSNISFSLSGKSTLLPTVPPAENILLAQHPLPSWSSGNSLVTGWTISHTVNLTANWDNNEDPLPVYYRPGESEYEFQVTTAIALAEHSLIKLASRDVELLEGVVTSRGRETGDQSGHFSYRVSLTNVRFGLDAFEPSSVSVIVANPTPDAWPEGT